MRTITRNPNPPDCLRQQPAEQDWYGFMKRPCHAEVSNSLHKEQYYLCCYCKLEIVDGDSHVEHMEPRSSNSGRAYDYDNLSASCNGGAVEHCGHFKDNRQKNPNFRYDAARFCPPHDSGTSQLLQYLLNGDIVVAPGLGSAEREKAEYMIGYLGLACPRLSGRRRAHARSLMQTLGASPAPDLLQWAENYHLKPDENNHLKQLHSLSKTILNK